MHNMRGLEKGCAHGGAEVCPSDDCVRGIGIAAYVPNLWERNPIQAFLDFIVYVPSATTWSLSPNN